MSWYKDGLKFECTRCGNCCTGAPGFVWVSLPEIYRIAEFLGLNDRDFGKKFLRKVDQRISLIEKPNGECIFYDQGCSIYPVRPSQCRTFPFWSENLRSGGSWKKAAAQCPGMDQGRLFSENEINALIN